MLIQVTQIQKKSQILCYRQILGLKLLIDVFRVKIFSKLCVVTSSFTDTITVIQPHLGCTSISEFAEPLQTKAQMGYWLYLWSLLIFKSNLSAIGLPLQSVQVQGISNDPTQQVLTLISDLSVIYQFIHSKQTFCQILGDCILRYILYISICCKKWFQIVTWLIFS